MTAAASEMPKVINPAERRRFVRIPCPPDASVRLRAGTSARLLDLGLGGALVESSTRITPGSVNATMFVGPDIAIRAHAHIVRAYVASVTREDDGNTALVYRAGLEFGPMSATEAGTLGTFVSAALRSAAPAVIPSERQISIRFPPGWTVTSRQDAVIARAPETSGFIFLGAPQSWPEGDLGETARVSMQEAGFSTLHGQMAEINGLPAWVGFYTGRLHDLGVVIVEAAHVVVDDRSYVVAGVAPWAAFETVRHEFFATINSFGSQPGVNGVQLITAPSSGAADPFELAAVASVA